MYMYVYIYIYTNLHINIYVHACIYTYTHYCGGVTPNKTQQRLRRDAGSRVLLNRCMIIEMADGMYQEGYLEADHELFKSYLYDLAIHKAQKAFSAGALYPRSLIWHPYTQGFQAQE